MPYFQNLLDDENEQNPGQVQISGASPTTEQESGGNSQGSQGGGGGGPKKDLNTGSGFQNLDKYLSTNQSQQFGNEVLGKVKNEVGTAQNNQKEASQKFQEQVAGANYVPTGDQVNQAIANPTSTKPADFQNWMQQSYEGPKSLAENSGTWNQYWSGANKANSTAQQLGTEAGRFSLLDSYFGKPSYNFGQKSLDNLLVQQSGLGRETRDVQNQATQLKSHGKDQELQLQTQANQRAAEVERSKEQARNAIGIDANGHVITGEGSGAIGKQYQAVEQQMANQNAQRAAEQQALIANLEDDSISAAEAAQLGLKKGQNLYNLNLKDYVTPGADLTKGQSMTAEQRSYIQALSQLAGVTDTFASDTPEAAAKAYSFDQAGFENAAKGAQAQYQQEMSPIISRMEEINNAIRSGKTDENYQGMLNVLRQQATNLGMKYHISGTSANAGRALNITDVPTVEKIPGLQDDYWGRR